MQTVWSKFVDVFWQFELKFGTETKKIDELSGFIWNFWENLEENIIMLSKNYK